MAGDDERRPSPCSSAFTGMIDLKLKKQPTVLTVQIPCQGHIGRNTKPVPKKAVDGEGANLIWLLGLLS